MVGEDSLITNGHINKLLWKMEIVWWTDIRQMDRRKSNVALAYPYLEEKSCSKFG